MSPSWLTISLLLHRHLLFHGHWDPPYLEGRWIQENAFLQNVWNKQDFLPTLGLLKNLSLVCLLHLSSDPPRSAALEWMGSWWPPGQGNGPLCPPHLAEHESGSPYKHMGHTPRYEDEMECLVGAQPLVSMATMGNIGVGRPQHPVTSLSEPPHCQKLQSWRKRHRVLSGGNHEAETRSEEEAENRQDVSFADLPWVSIKQLDRRIKWPEHPKTFQCDSWENPNANQPSALLHAKSSCVDHKLLWRPCWCESPFFLSWGCWFSDPAPAPYGRGTFYSHSILAAGRLPDTAGSWCTWLGDSRQYKGRGKSCRDSLQISEQKAGGLSHAHLHSSSPLIVHRPRGLRGCFLCFLPASLLFSTLCIHTPPSCPVLCHCLPANQAAMLLRMGWFMEGNKNNPKDNNKQIGEMKGLLNTQPRQGSVPLYTDRSPVWKSQTLGALLLSLSLPPLFLFIVFQNQDGKKVMHKTELRCIGLFMF